MKRYNLSLNDQKENYFHFTWKNNLESIEKDGLVPKKGKRAQYVEETKKVFFVQGLDNLLILFDCWINIYKMKPLITISKNFKLWGSKALRSKYFPMFLVDFYFFLIKNSNRHKKQAYKVFTQMLEECVLLNLDIKEEVDFSFSDKDEIKARGYRKRHLITLGYSKKYSDMNSEKMDSWNLHTLSGKGIAKEKLSICYIKKSCSMNDILNYALENTKINLKEVCPVLFDYIKSDDFAIK